jgi:sugar-specific transcriptional regulator TrmB
VYIALLELGSGSASTVSKVADFNRITTYEALKRLSKKGLLLIRAKRNSSTKYFTPVEFGDLIEKLEEKAKEMQSVARKAKSMENLFKASFAKAEDKPVVLFYEGVDGVQEVLNDSLRQTPREILSFASIEYGSEAFGEDFLKSYWKKRTALNIPTRGIVPATKNAREKFTKERNELEIRSLRFIDPNLYSFKNEIDIYGDNVGIMSLPKGSEHGIIIRSKSVADSLRTVFELAWKLSKDN